MIIHGKGKHLINLVDLTEADEEGLAQRKERARLAEEANTRDQLELSGKIALLGLDDRLATTRKERLRIELQLLGLQEKAAIREQQAIIDANQPNSEAAKNARTTIEQIKAQSPRNRAQVEQQNEGPLAAYRRHLHDAVGDTNDAIEQVEVDGLQGLEDQLTSTIGKVLRLKGAFGETAESIIADLIRIGIEKTILSAIGGGSGSGGDHGIGSALASFFGGGRASGGAVDSSRFYLVGENGPELFAPGSSGTIVPNEALRAPTVGPAYSSRGTAPLYFDLRGAVMTEDLLAQMQDMAAQSGGEAVRLSVDHTNRSLSGVLRKKL